MRVPAAVAAALVAGLSVPVCAVPAAADADVACGDRDDVRLVDDAAANRTARLLGYPALSRAATGAGVTIAVVDSGVAAGPHFSSGLLPGVSLVGGSPTTDLTGHGTAVAGIAAARSVDGSVLSGVAPAADVLPVRVYRRVPDTALIARGIRWAADHGADVVNVSLSTGGLDPDLAVLRDAVAHAVDAGVLVVASAGNQTRSRSLEAPRYPATLPGVLGVAASDADGAVGDWSIHGPQVDVAAPGDDVLVPWKADGDCVTATSRPYASWSTAFVSGLAAQLMQQHPDETAVEVAARITRSTGSSTRDDRAGHGVVDPARALADAPAAAPVADAPTDDDASTDDASPWALVAWLVGGLAVLVGSAIVGLRIIWSQWSRPGSGLTSDRPRPGDDDAAGGDRDA